MASERWTLNAARDCRLVAPKLPDVPGFQHPSFRVGRMRISTNLDLPASASERGGLGSTVVVPLAGAGGVACVPFAGAAGAGTRIPVAEHLCGKA